VCEMTGYGLSEHGKEWPNDQRLSSEAQVCIGMEMVMLVISGDIHKYN